MLALLIRFNGKLNFIDGNVIGSETTIKLMEAKHDLP